MAHRLDVGVVETATFTRRIVALLPDDDYRLLQIRLALQPDAGDLIPGSGGLRKIRSNVPGSGKRGGLRIVYYWAQADAVIYMPYVYRKNRQEDLTFEQLRTLRRLVRGALR